MIEQKTQNLLSVIIPVYNEQDNVLPLIGELEKVLCKIGMDHELIFINDGSSDLTLAVLIDHALRNKYIKIINFTRNFGHQKAVMAGLTYCQGDCAVIIDADLQDPPALIQEFVEKWKEGYHIVFGQRSKRKGESIFKKATASAFYRLLKRMTSIPIPVDTGDFRLIDRVVIDTLKKMPEKEKFLRGLIAWTGYRSVGVPFVREKRFSGQTKYNFRKMMKFAITGITSFSNVPLSLATLLGYIASLIAFAVLLYSLFVHFFTNRSVAGWTSTIIVILFLGGIQLIVLGIIGQYIGFINEEVKKRPPYLIEGFYNIENSDKLGKEEPKD